MANPYRRYSGEFNEQAADDLATGRRAESTYIDRATGYNAQEAASTAARGHFDQFQEEIDKRLREFRGTQVGQGRLDSGFRFEDEDELWRQGLSDLGRTFAQNAMQAEGLNLRNMEGIGGYGERVTGRGLDVMASERDAGIAEEELRRRDQANRRSGLFGTLGRVGGTLLGPAGSMVGGKLSEQLERLIS